jgi:hypothetical protein
LSGSRQFEDGNRRSLDAVAYAMSDNQAAERLNRARTELFQSIQRRSKRAA